MHINVKLMGWMREFLGDGIPHFTEQDFDLAEAMTLGQLCDKFGFRGEVQFMAMQNGDRVAENELDATVLHEGDNVVFVPPLKGG